MRSLSRQVAVLPVDWARFSARQGRRPLWRELVTATARPAAEPPSLVAQWRAAPPAERRGQLVAHLRGAVAAVLGWSSPQQVGPKQRLFDLGMDSLTSVELRHRLERDLGCALPVTTAFDYPTVEALAGYLTAQLKLLESETEEEDVAPAPAFDVPSAAALSALSDDGGGGAADGAVAQRELRLMKASPETHEELSPLKRAYLAWQQAEARLAAWQAARREGIAVVGLGCRLPGGVATAADCWALLSAGRDAIGEVPADRWDADRYYDADADAPGKMVTRQGGFLSTAVDRFDAGFFAIAPREAQSLDPQQRLLLETAVEALEDAAWPIDGLSGTAGGVFVGISTADYYSHARVPG